jgi:hypothetical protein
LSALERLALIGDLWDGFSDAEPPTPPAQRVPRFDISGALLLTVKRQGAKSPSQLLLTRCLTAYLINTPLKLISSPSRRPESFK